MHRKIREREGGREGGQRILSTTGRSNFQNRWRNFWEKLAINFSVENEGVREEGQRGGLLYYIHKMLKRNTPSDSEEACLDFGRMAAQVLELEPEGMTSSFVFSEDSSDEHSTSGTEVLDNFHRKRKVLWKKHDQQEQEVDQNVLKILQSIKKDARASDADFVSEKN